MTMPAAKKRMSLKGRLDCDPATGHVYLIRESDSRSVEIEDWLETNFRDRTLIELDVSEG
jgi:hypothetical protein